MNKLELMKTANEVRKGIVTAVHSAKSGHPGGSLSAADIYTYLYFEEMNIDPKDPKKADRDRFVLSKGHTAPGYYSTLAHRGFFPVEDLTTLRKVGSYLQGHPDMKHIPGVDMSSGSLGQGISAAVGMAISAKLSDDDYRVYTLLGDGEIQEGQVWEASMLAGHRKLDNLVVIVDNNNLQIDGKITDVNSPYPIDKKFCDIEEISAEQRVMMDLYPEIYSCVGCNACTKGCPQSLNVMQYIAYAQRGDFKKCAEESFDCIGCGICASRCPAGISHPMVGELARRLNGKYIAPKSEHVKNRVAEIKEGKFDDLIEQVMQKPIEEMQELYNNREIEK